MSRPQYKERKESRARTAMKTRFAVTIWGLFCSAAAIGSSRGAMPAAALTAKPVPASRKVAAEIRSQTTLPPNGPAGRPLPLVSHWNMGRVPAKRGSSQGGGWTPQYQVKLLDKGHHILPWLGWPSGDPDTTEKSAKRFGDYYDDLLAYCRELGLPISFRGTQWGGDISQKEISRAAA